MEKGYKLTAVPPDVSAVREDFERFLADLENRGIKRVELVFGIGWALDIYPDEWKPESMAVADVRNVVSDAETKGFGKLGSDDLVLTIAELRAERFYCHEGDIHLESEVPSAYTESAKVDWIEQGWTVSERTR